MATRAVIYRRVSRDEQVSGFSLTTQQQQCLAYCEEHGYEVVGDFEESGSGADMDEREQLTQVRRMMRAHQFDVLVVWKFDRLHRNQTNQAVVMYESKKHGVRIESVKEQVDDTPVGQFLTSVHAFRATMEGEDIRMRTMEGTRRRVESGMPLVGKCPPFGYEWGYSVVKGRNRKTHLVPSPTTAAVIPQIYQMVANGDSLRTVVDWLEAEQVPTCGGQSTWRKSTLYRILRNPVYWGQPTAYRTQQIKVLVTDDNGEAKTKKRSLARPLEDVVVLPESAAPPLVSPELAAMAHQRLKASGASPHSARIINPERYLLRNGYAVCGTCGHVMSCRRRNGRHEFYTCYWGADSRSQRHYTTAVAPYVDAFAREELYRLLNQSEVIEAAKERMRAEYVSGNAEELDAVRGVLNELKRKRARLWASLVDYDNDEQRAPLRVLDKQLAEQEDEHRARLVVLSQTEERYRAQLAALQRVESMMETWNAGVLSDGEVRNAMFALSMVIVVNARNHQPALEARCDLIRRQYLAEGNTVSLRSGLRPLLPTVALLGGCMLKTGTDGAWRLV